VWKNLGSEIHKIAHPFSVSDNQLEAFCHALVVGCFDHYSYPQTAAMEETPNLVDSIECVSSITRTGNFNIDDLPLSQHKFINRVAEATRDRSVYKTAGGKFGTAPICIEPGDIVVALFGFDTAMILRRADGNTYEVIGQTYCYGYMSCEGFLGLLPNTHRMVWIHDPRDVGLRRAYLHKESGVLEVEDPRLGPLLNGWEIIDHDAQHLHHRFTNKETRETTDFDPRLTPEALLERGVDIQYFDLV
jgi:hypothetical protein